MRRVRALRACAAAVLAVSLAGCMKVDMQLELNTDDTVDGTMVMAFSKDVSNMVEAMGEDPASLFEEMDAADLPENTEVSDYEDDDFVGQQYTFDGTSLDEFAEGEDGFGIVHEGDEFVVTGEMDMSSMGDMSDLEEQLGEGGGAFGDPQELMESMEIGLSITFPGEVVEHNGELDGTTVTWTPQLGENLEISARAEDSGGAGGMPVWVWIVIALAVVALLIALLFFMSRNRSRSEPAAAGSVPPPPPADVAPSTGETQLSSAEAAASQVATDAGRDQPPHGTPLGAEESEQTPGGHQPTRPIETGEEPGGGADGDQRR